MNARDKQVILRQKSHFHLAQLINGVNALRLVDLAQVYQNEQGELFANKHLHKVFDSLDAYYDACKKYDEACLEDDAFCQAYLEKHGRKPQKVGDDVERFVEVLEEDINSIKNKLDCSTGEGARKCCTKLLYLADSQHVFDTHRFLFNQLAVSYAKSYGLAAADVEPDRLKYQASEWHGDQRDTLKQACRSYLDHLRLSILSESGKSKLLNTAVRDEVELGLKIKNHAAFSTSDDNSFAGQLKRLRIKGQNNPVLTVAIKKYDELTRLQSLLTNNNLSDRDALSKFKKRYLYAKPLLEQRRDTAASRFFKIVASILTLGAGSFFIWRVHGRELTARIDKQLDGFENKMLKR